MPTQVSITDCDKVRQERQLVEPCCVFCHTPEWKLLLFALPSGEQVCCRLEKLIRANVSYIEPVSCDVKGKYIDEGLVYYSQGIWAVDVEAAVQYLTQRAQQDIARGLVTVREEVPTQQGRVKS